MEHKGRFIVRLFSLLVVLIVIGAAVAYGYRWHVGQMDARDFACSQAEIEAQKLQEKQDRQIGRLIDQFHMDNTSYKLESFVGGVRIKLLNNTGMYYEARKGTEDITVHFTGVSSPATR